MGDPKTEKDLRRQDDGVTLCPSNTEPIVGSNFSVSDENRGTPGPSPAFLATLSSLGEHTDHMLLPRSLHQIAEAYFYEENYQWAVQFLHLEMLYHERLISNIASMQKDWESQGKAVSQAKISSSVRIPCTETETKCMNALNFICRTHQRPYCNVKKISAENPLKMKDWTEDPEEEKGDEEDREALGQEALTEEVQKEVPGRQKLSREEVAELIKVEETFTSNGLISILKKRTRTPEESSPVDTSPTRSSSKLKVHFIETNDLLDNDDEGEDSCLFFLALCLVTVVISMGGTMLYCALGGAYSNICSDFSHNMNFFLGVVYQVVETVTRLFFPASA
ncbi:consortin, connexin sorting protein b isoform 2-T3 [Clarias gariepinus]|uniref:consortin, connexin sorting protein b isoform X2 n=1 Tax=Clarias gariepinus TaxID=13013 RepID=UPI00234D6C38|nr:consortin, connexin sorting protein b isoform X2 [Clarias gariepinus]